MRSRTGLLYIGVVALLLAAVTVFGATINVPADYGSIQAAVDAAAPGDVIVIAAGTYTEQIHIQTDNLTLVGAGVGSTIVQSPATLTDYYVTGTSTNNYPVVFIDGVPAAALQDMTVDGANQGNANYRFNGVAFWNSGGLLTDVDVLNVMDSTFSGSQHGIGIYANNDTGDPYSVTMTDVLVDDYQKGGVVMNGAGLTADLTRVTTVGQGDTDVTAQNGIQFGYGSSGTVTDCEIYGNSYVGTDNWTASGLLFTGAASVDAEGSLMDGNQTSVYIYSCSDPCTLVDCSVVNPVGDALYAWGTGGAKSGLYDRPLPSPYDAAELPGGRVATYVSVSGCTFTGSDIAGSWGPSAVASGGGSGELVLSDCEISHWEYGIVNYEFDTGADAAVATPSGCSIHDNISYGYYNAGDVDQEAAANWWGDASGPYNSNSNPDGAGDSVSDGVDYSPWLGDTPGASPMTWHVSDSIQDAIDAAYPGDEVVVGDGTYNEAITIDKALTLRAGSSPVISPGYGSAGITISNDDITIQGMTIHTCSLGIVGYLDDVDYNANFGYSNVKILDNTIYDVSNSSHGFGIYLGTESERYNPADPIGIYDPSLTSLLDFTGLEISGNEIYDTSGAAVCLQSMTSTSGPLLLADNYIHESDQSGLWIDAVQKLDVTSNTFEANATGVFMSNYGDGYYEGTADAQFDPKDIGISGNIFSANGNGVSIYDAWPSLLSIAYNSFTGNTGNGVYNYLSTSADATSNWWGDASGPSGSGPGSGDAVSAGILYDPWIGKSGGENIVCDPDPLDLTEGVTSGTIDVNYLGGGGGMMYGYSVTVTWDDTVADLTGITEGNLLSDAGTTYMFVTGSGNTRTIDCVLTGAAAGVTGPGTMFTLAFDADSYGETPVDITLVKIRDKDNDPLSGFYEDDGHVRVDITDPVVTAAWIDNSTLPHTNDYAKNLDDLRLYATITDDYPLTAADVTADLSTLLVGGGTAVHPDNFTP